MINVKYNNAIQKYGRKQYVFKLFNRLIKITFKNNNRIKIKLF